MIIYLFLNQPISALLKATALKGKSILLRELMRSTFLAYREGDARWR